MPRNIDYNIQEVLSQLGDTSFCLFKRTQEVFDLENRLLIAAGENTKLVNQLQMATDACKALAERCQQLEPKNG